MRPTQPVANARKISSNCAQPPSVGTGTLTIGAATGVKTAETVHGAVIAPVTNGLWVVVTPPQPLMLVNVKPAFATAAQVVVLPNDTGLGKHVATPPFAEIATVVTGTEISTKFAVTVQAPLIAPVA